MVFCYSSHTDINNSEVVDALLVPKRLQKRF